jgi:preprotein translocase SecE subunit
MESEESLAVRADRYIREVRAEARKIVWPDLRRTAVLTAVVLVTVAFLAGVVYVADVIFRAILH